MYKKPYQGAYSRRRFSNTTVVANGGTPSSNGVTYYTLNISSRNPAMGGVDYEVTQLPSLSASEIGSSGQVVVNRDGSVSLPAGTVVRVKASPNSGYRFVSWAHNLSTGTGRQNNPQLVTMNRNVTMVANFTAVSIHRTLKVLWDETMGRVTTNGNGMQNGSLSATPGSQITLNATPNDGYVFKGWQGVQLAGNVQSNESRTITITMPDRDITLTAVFAQATQTPGGGGGTPGGGTSDGPDGPTPIDPPGTQSQIVGPSLINQVVPFVKKWWWAIAIVAWLVYDSRKGGSK